MQPLVLAIEPDLRQAAIVKRIVREKVLAEVTVVDSRDAAMAAIRTTMPDVLLLSALLSPRDEDELIADLRALQNAEHLQTHTIPQLASTLGDDDDKPSKGLLSAFKRRKGSAKKAVTTTGCDPDLFAEEIRTYLQRASEKKREVRDAAAAGTFVPSPVKPSPAIAAASRRDAVEAEEPTSASSWSSPFEWRPSTVSRTATVVEPEPPVLHQAAALEPVEAVESAVFRESIVLPEPLILAEPVEVASEPIFAIEPLVAEPVVEAPFAFAEAPALTIVEKPAASAPRGPLVVRIARGWWYEEGNGAAPSDPVSELRSVLTSLTVPLAVAAIRYAEGCRIRRVRVAAA